MKPEISMGNSSDQILGSDDSDLSKVESSSSVGQFLDLLDKDLWRQSRPMDEERLAYARSLVKGCSGDLDKPLSSNDE